MGLLTEVKYIQIHSVNTGKLILFSTDTCNYWKAQIFTTAGRMAFKARNPFQSRCLLIVSHIQPPNDAMLTVVIQAFIERLEASSDVSGAEAFILYLARSLHTSSDHAQAACLFWVAMGTSQVPDLFGSSIQLLTAATDCIIKYGLSGGDDLHAYLIRARQISPEVEDASSTLDKILDTDFSPEYFSFAITGLIVKGIKLSNYGPEVISRSLL